MAIVKSNFIAREHAAAVEQNGEGARRAARATEEFARDREPDAGESTAGPGEAVLPGDGVDVQQLRDLRDAVHGIFSSSATEILGAIAVLQQIGRHIETSSPNAVDGPVAIRHAERNPGPDALGGTRQEDRSGSEVRGDFELPDHSGADLEQRFNAASRVVASRGSDSQEEMRALLEQAVAVMESLAERSANTRLDDLKRRVAVLEQRVSSDRGNARS